MLSQAQFTVAKMRSLKGCLENISSFSQNQARIIDWDDKLEDIRVEVRPTDGLYKGAEIVFQIGLPDGFPYVPPVVSCLSAIYHPNILPGGDICLNLFEEWQTSFSLEDVVQGLLFLVHNPNIEDPLSSIFNDITEEQFHENVKKSLKREDIHGYIVRKDSKVTPTEEIGWVKPGEWDLNQLLNQLHEEAQKDVTHDMNCENADPAEFTYHIPGNVDGEYIEVSRQEALQYLIHNTSVYSNPEDEVCREIIVRPINLNGQDYVIDSDDVRRTPLASSEDDSFERDRDDCHSAAFSTDGSYSIAERGALTPPLATSSEDLFFPRVDIHSPPSGAVTVQPRHHEMSREHTPAASWRSTVSDDIDIQTVSSRISLADTDVTDGSRKKKKKKKPPSDDVEPKWWVPTPCCILTSIIIGCVYLFETKDKELEEKKKKEKSAKKKIAEMDKTERKERRSKSRASDLDSFWSV